MIQTSDISFLSLGEIATAKASSLNNPILSQSLGRITGVATLSLGAALDIVFHTAWIPPTILYSVGKSLYLREVHFTLPWQHLQRVRNAISPLLLGSLFSAIHPYAGIALSEPADKHIAMGILSSNSGLKCNTVCSPIRTLELIESFAKEYSTTIVEGKKIEIFSKEHLAAIQSAKRYEKLLESLQAQEYLFKISNVTLALMATLLSQVRVSNLGNVPREILERAIGCFIPPLLVIDMAIATVAQAVFLATGTIQFLTGRSPIYTEVTKDPLMHLAFFLQNIFKTVGVIIGTPLWFITPELGFKASLIPSNLFFKLQVETLMLRVWLQSKLTKEHDMFAMPILYNTGELSALAIPYLTSHKTYLLVQKEKENFQLQWTDRPSINTLSTPDPLPVIKNMLLARYPFMDMEKMLDYPVKSDMPPFESTSREKIDDQGNSTNCVVSNLFGLMEAVDLAKGSSKAVSLARNKCVREGMLRKYNFYKLEFFPDEDLNHTIYNALRFIGHQDNNPI